jgi:cysteine synthase A
MLYASFTDFIGNTPMLQLGNFHPAIFAKQESRNPAHSIKDRIALSMILDAESRGLLKPGVTIIEATSGNTGIGLAAIGASKGYKVMLSMPETMSIERRKVLASLGAELILTPGAEGMRGAVARAEALVVENQGRYFMPQQFKNPANPNMHYKTTGPEIWKDMNGKVDVFVAGVGTGGTITGAGRYLREQNPSIEVIAVEPDESPVISQLLAGEPLKPSPHKIQGIGAGFIPDTLDVKLLSRVIRVKSADAIEMSQRMGREAGLLAGFSAGANVWAALQIASDPAYVGKQVVTILPDGSERYLSMINP